MGYNIHCTSVGSNFFQGGSLFQLLHIHLCIEDQRSIDYATFTLAKVHDELIAEFQTLL